MTESINQCVSRSRSMWSTPTSRHGWTSCNPAGTHPHPPQWLSQASPLPLSPSSPPLSTRSSFSNVDYRCINEWHRCIVLSRDVQLATHRHGWKPSLGRTAKLDQLQWWRLRTNRQLHGTLIPLSSPLLLYSLFLTGELHSYLISLELLVATDIRGGGRGRILPPPHLRGWSRRRSWCCWPRHKPPERHWIPPDQWFVSSPLLSSFSYLSLLHDSYTKLTRRRSEQTSKQPRDDCRCCRCRWCWCRCCCWCIPPRPFSPLSLSLSPISLSPISPSLSLSLWSSLGMALYEKEAPSNRGLLRPRGHWFSRHG